jgi:beta-lactamase superfamily II metal-dependent hydrolase
LLVRSLKERGVPLEIAAQGFSETRAGALMQMLWPPADLVSKGANDTSLVLSISTPASTGATHRLLLNGDIQKQATWALLEAGVDLRADVTDLPHHGGINAASPEWLPRVAPQMVLQSSRPKPPARDHWPPIINTAGIMRLATTDSGMVQIDFNHDGTIRVSRYKPQRASVGDRR